MKAHLSPHPSLIREYVRIRDGKPILKPTVRIAAEVAAEVKHRWIAIPYHPAYAQHVSMALSKFSVDPLSTSLWQTFFHSSGLPRFRAAWKNGSLHLQQRVKRLAGASTLRYAVDDVARGNAEDGAEDGSGNERSENGSLNG